MERPHLAWPCGPAQGGHGGWRPQERGPNGTVREGRKHAQAAADPGARARPAVRLQGAAEGADAGLTDVAPRSTASLSGTAPCGNESLHVRPRSRQKSASLDEMHRNALSTVFLQ